MKGHAADVHLIRYEDPYRSNVKTKVDLLVLSGDELVPDFGHALSQEVCHVDLRPHESMIILSVSVLYTHSDLQNETVELEIYNLWPSCFPSNEGKHPDFTGSFTIVIPPAPWNGIPSNKDTRIVYQPRWAVLGFNALAYAGYEHQILEARSTCITYQGIQEAGAGEYQAFLTGDPLIRFLMEHKRHFPELESEDIVKLTACEGYMIKRRLVERVQNFFRTTLFPLYRYKPSGASGLKFRPPAGKQKLPPRGTVAVMLQMDYVVISTNIGAAPLRVFDLK